ncbi:MAG: hypothetical protein IPI66_15490 [Chitinophagaceae bacterium]|nr:hypothetical protein [Chitinophagaceae bacterium]
MIDFALYSLAYRRSALFAYGAFGGKDPVGKWGYKRGIVWPAFSAWALRP